MCESHAEKCPRAGHHLFKPYLQKNQALHPCDQGRFSPDMLLRPWAFEKEGRKDWATFQATCGLREMKPHQTKLKEPRLWQMPCHRGNARVGISQMARKGTRASCQKLKSNLSLLEPYTTQYCQQNGQMQTTGSHKVVDVSLGQMSSGAWHSYLTNANPPLFSCTWGGLSMQQVCIQILCAQTQLLPFEIIALNAFSFCCNA